MSAQPKGEVPPEAPKPCACARCLRLERERDGAREQLRAIASFVVEHPQAAKSMGLVAHGEWVSLQALATQALATLKPRV